MSTGPLNTAPLNTGETPRNKLPEMPLLEHLGELRKRLFAVIIAVFLGALVCYSFSQFTFELLTKPYFEYFPSSSLIGTGPAEAFILKMKVALVASIMVTSPFTFYQLWLFLAPGLYEEEKKLVVPFVLITSLLFLLGAAICYFFILPVTFGFFKEQYDSIAITPQIRVSEQLSLVMKAVLGFALIFEMPVLTYFLARLEIVTSKFLLDKARYAVVIIFILAAILTPTPDVMTQLLFAVPLLILYGISIGVAYFAAPQDTKNSEDTSLPES